MKLVIGNYNYSSWSLRAWLLLQQFGIEFETQRIALFSGDYREQILQVNPAGKVPVLMDDALTVWDSLAICEYVNEQYLDGKGWPGEPALKAHARSSCAEMHSGFFDLRQQMPMNCRRFIADFEITAAVEKDVQRICQLWQHALQLSGSQQFLYGEFSIADAFYAPVVFRFSRYGIELPHALQKYCQRMLALPGMQQWLKLAEAEAEVIEEAEM